MFHFPRFFTFSAAVLTLTVLCTLSIAQDKPAETPKPADVAVPAVQVPAAADEAKPETFPVVPEGENKDAPQSFADVEPEVGPDPSGAGEAKAEVAKPPVPFDRTLTFTVLVFAVILIGTYYLGDRLAKHWRLPDHSFRIFLLLFTCIGAVVAVFLGLKQDRLTLGIDLQGGVVLVYDVTWEKDKPRNVEQLVHAIAQRINPGGIKEISITPLGANCNQLQVIIPKAEEAEVNRVERIISESGALTFRILASKLYPADNQIIQRGEKEPGRDIRDGAGKLLARWVPAYEQEKERFIHNSDIITRERNGKAEVLVKFDDGVDITGEYLSAVGEGVGEKGERGVSFSFNAVGESKFKRLTRANQPDPVQERLKRQLGIILNDSLYSAPTIDAVIGAHGIITFRRQSTQEGQLQQNREIKELIQILNAGALPADLNPDTVSRSLIGATLGADTIQKGKVALIGSTLAVLVFMVCYYRLAGVIACFCVIANTVMLLAIMLAFRAAFTLPGLAGIVLAIGMAVDANVLIYERLREELRNGSTLKLAIHNAYEKAFSAIFDGNITTLITAVILYAIGTEQVKGFAVTLFLGLVLNLFTAVYLARVIMDIFEAQRWVKTFRMMQMFKRPNINFLAAGKYTVTLSAVLILIGLAATVARGKGIFNIDFVGGVSVEAVFKDTQSIGFVRTSLFDKDETIDNIEDRLNDLSVQNVQMTAQDKTGSTKPNTHYILTSSIPQVSGKDVSPEAYLGTVRNIIKETFGDKLVYRQFNYTAGETKKNDDKVDTEVKLDIFPPANQAAVQSEIAAAVKKAADGKQIDNEFSFSVSRADLPEGTSQSFTDWVVTVQAPKETLEKVFAPLKAEADAMPYFPTSTTVGGSVAKDTQVAGLAALIASIVMILVYVRVRFSNVVFGLTGILALIHDVLMVLGFIALSYWLAGPLAFLQVEEFKIGLSEVAAFLTIIGYSINDTIVLFDRIRENRGKGTVITKQMINDSMNQVLSRSVLTSLSTLLVAVILFFWGGSGIHAFAFAMTLGVIFGSYSSIFLCAPMLYWLLGAKEELSQAVRA
ncbi:MAG: protein translocase subunit SecD [Planctomycetaceae bacterium]|jgi:SecD/SecF fusion protein|nr:protein translocase subunit SecD [Planctomycetaceae bacterium]